MTAAEEHEVPRLDVPRRPAWGVGIGYRYCIHDLVMHNAGLLDFLEIPAGDYLTAKARRRVDPDERLLREAASRYPVISHGTEVSIGSAAPPDPQHLVDLDRFLDRLPISEYSEHLSFTCAGNESVSSFICLPFTDLGVEVASAKARAFQRHVGLPLHLENVSYYFAIPDAGMTEQAFIRRVATEADCGILLDVANVFINATNHGYEPADFIRGLPGDRIHQAHYCGSSTDPDGFLIDTHSTVTSEEIWALLDLALATTDLRALVFERDTHLERHDEMLDELLQARRVFRRHRPKNPPVPYDAPVRRTRDPVEPVEVPASYGDMERFQETLLRLLTDTELSDAVNREGERALRHTKLGPDERRILAAISHGERERLGSRLRQERVNDARRREDQRRAELKAWMRMQPNG